MTRDLLEVVNESGRETFQKLASHVDGAETREFGAITGVSTGFPAPVYNQLISFEAPASDDLRAGVEWMVDQDVPFWFSLPESVAETDAVTPSAFDLVESDEVAPAMALPSLTDSPANSTPASITEVTDSDALQEFIQVFSDVFGMPEPLAERAHSESMLDDPDMGLFVGRIDERPVACGHLVKTDGVAGVYSIGVVEESRRQGIGEAMTWAVLQAGREAGCDIGVLQSSEMAYSLYQTMGFETVTRYHRYELES